MERLGHGLLGAFVGALISFGILIWLSDPIGWMFVFMGVFFIASLCAGIGARYGEPALLKMKDFLDTFLG